MFYVVTPPRLSRKDAWGRWHLDTARTTLVFDSRDSAYYEVPLADLSTFEDARLRVETVVALKTGWVDQRAVDDLVRAIRKVKGFQLPYVPCEQRDR